MAKTRITQHDGRGTWLGNSKSVTGTLAVAAGYGLAISALTVLSVQQMFGTTGPGGRLAVLGLTVGALVLAAGAMCARRSWQRRRPNRSHARRA